MGLLPLFSFVNMEEMMKKTPILLVPDGEEGEGSGGNEEGGGENPIPKSPRPQNPGDKDPQEETGSDPQPDSKPSTKKS